MSHRLVVRCRRWRFYPSWLPFGFVVSEWTHDGEPDWDLVNELRARGVEVLAAVPSREEEKT